MVISEKTAGIGGTPPRPYLAEGDRMTWREKSLSNGEGGIFGGNNQTGKCVKWTVFGWPVAIH